ncbi:CotH kinase family protein [Algibacter pacificus]|uniref:CotH kinase family protein n=1 Tax=Algibacter pacificus TaxID=2599389 RepID=UPI0011CABA80|nr:CotH kinase family protein [Algibacter pacificus]
MKKIKSKIVINASVVLAFIVFNACSNGGASIDVVEDDNEEVVVDIDDTDFEPTDWTDETHSKDVDPNFDKVFEDGTVKRLDLVITEERWQNMLDDMTNLYGSFGGVSGGPNVGGPNVGGPGPGGPGGGQVGGLSDVDDNPVFVPGEVFFQGKEWYRVGIRFKGNSSLQSAWQAGILKLSFKLDFDEFEDDYPQIKNQRFYGFKKLSLKNNYNDSSMMREKVAADVFKNFGLAVSNTAFYTVYVDHGDGPEYFGVYTLVEEVDDTVIDTQFDDNDGNLYKPDGDAASFASGTYDEDEYVKKTNEDDGDFSDVASLLDILHDSSRTSDPAAWRASLETVFDTDVFLKYLAVNTVIQNWDTYGIMTHNYFLYNNPDTSKLTWIPWDNNEALQTGNQGGSLELDFSDLRASSWPIIDYLYNDETYKAKYDTYVQEVIDGSFNTATMQALYDSYATLLEAYATSEVDGYTFLSSSSSFQIAVSQLKSHVSSRASAVNSYLNN